MLQEYLDGNGKHFTKADLARALTKAGWIDKAEIHGLLKSLESKNVDEEHLNSSKNSTTSGKITIPLISLSMLKIIIIFSKISQQQAYFSY